MMLTLLLPQCLFVFFNRFCFEVISFEKTLNCTVIVLDARAKETLAFVRVDEQKNKHPSLV